MAVENGKIVKVYSLSDAGDPAPKEELKEEEFNLEKVATELLLESKAIKDYELFSKIALAGFWISLLLVIVNFMKV